MTYMGHIRGGVVVIDGKLDLPEGTPVRVDPIPSEASVEDAKSEKTKYRRAGTAKGMIEMSPDFDAPLVDFEDYM